MVGKVQAVWIIREDELLHDMFLPAFMITLRNNEMIELFAKYFL
jgi:hypothetical protein